MSAVFLLCLLGVTIGLWFWRGDKTGEWDLWAMIESLSTAFAVLVAIVGAFWAYQDTAQDRSLDVADRLFQDINSDENIEARRMVYQQVPEFSERAIEQLDGAQRAAIKRTLNSLDRAGFMIQSNWIPADLILPWISPMVVKIWAKLGPYVEYEVRDRPEPDYYEAARDLAQRCQTWRAKNVPDAEIRWRKNAL